MTVGVHPARPGSAAAGLRFSLLPCPLPPPLALDSILKPGICGAGLEQALPRPATRSSRDPHSRTRTAVVSAEPDIGPRDVGHPGHGPPEGACSPALPTSSWAIICRNRDHELASLCAGTSSARGEAGGREKQGGEIHGKLRPAAARGGKWRQARRALQLRRLSKRFPALQGAAGAARCRPHEGPRGRPRGKPPGRRHRRQSRHRICGHVPPLPLLRRRLPGGESLLSWLWADRAAAQPGEGTVRGARIG